MQTDIIAATIVSATPTLALVGIALEREWRDINQQDDMDPKRVLLSAITAAESVLPLVPGGEGRPLAALDAAWDVMGTPSEKNREAAAEAAKAAYLAAVDLCASNEAAEAAADAAAAAALAALYLFAPKEAWNHAYESWIAARAAIRAAEEALT